MSNPDAQSINTIVCNLNKKVYELDAMMTAIELMLNEISWGNGQDPRCLHDLTERLQQIHCLSCLAKEHAKEAVTLADVADSATVGLYVAIAA